MEYDDRTRNFEDYIRLLVRISWEETDALKPLNLFTGSSCFPNSGKSGEKGLRRTVLQYETAQLVLENSQL